MIDLSTIGLNKGIHYETIITTQYNGKSNAAPIGVICTGKDSVMCRIFKTSCTLRNIKKTNKFIVNIVDNPLAFTYSTLSNVPESFFDVDNSLKCSNSYFKCEVETIKDVVKDVDPVNKSEKSIIKAQAVEIKVNKKGKPINRAMDLLIESIYNLRKVEEDTDYYLRRFREAKRIITKVGSKNDKKAIKLIINELKNKDYDL